MTTELRLAPIDGPTPAPAQARHSGVLASALAHLLDRDGDRPARWHTPGFAQAVERHRQSLLAVRAIPGLAVASGSVAGAARAELDFAEATGWLARDPAQVAIAIRRLELAGHHRLPAWSDLVRRGLPARPSELDRALWFG